MGPLGILSMCAAAIGGLAFLRSRRRRRTVDPGDLGPVTTGWLAEQTARRHEHA